MEKRVRVDFWRYADIASLFPSFAAAIVYHTPDRLWKADAEKRWRQENPLNSPVRSGSEKKRN